MSDISMSNLSQLATLGRQYMGILHSPPLHFPVCFIYMMSFSPLCTKRESKIIAKVKLKSTALLHSLDLVGFKDRLIMVPLNNFLTLQWCKSNIYSVEMLL